MKTTNISNTENHFVASLNAVPACQPRDGDTDWFPAVDVTETEQEYVFDVDLPGLKPKEIQMGVRSDGLFISGQRVTKHQGGERLRRIPGHLWRGNSGIARAQGTPVQQARTSQSHHARTRKGYAMTTPAVELALQIRSKEGLHRWKFHSGVFDLAMESP